MIKITSISYNMARDIISGIVKQKMRILEIHSLR